MAAPQQNVRDIQEQIKGIQAALQAFNTPEGPDEKTLAERLEGSRTHEYIVLRALLKRNLGFRYNEDRKMYECPLAEYLQELSEQKASIERNYPIEIRGAEQQAADNCSSRYSLLQESKIGKLTKLLENIRKVHEEIRACGNRSDSDFENAADELTKLKEERAQLKEQFFSLRENIDDDKKSQDEEFISHRNKLVQEAKKRCLNDADVILGLIKSFMDNFNHYDGNILTFSPDEKEKYNLVGDVLLYDEEDHFLNRSKVSSDTRKERREDMDKAVLAITESMLGNPRNSRVFDYQPTQKVSDFLAAIDERVRKTSQENAEDYLPDVPLSSLDEFFASMTDESPMHLRKLKNDIEKNTKTLHQLQDDIQKEFSEAERCIERVTAIQDIRKNINVLLYSAADGQSPAERLSMLVTERLKLERLKRENGSQSAEIAADQNGSAELLQFIEENSDFIDGSFEEADLMNVREFIFHGEYATAKSYLKKMRLIAEQKDRILERPVASSSSSGTVVSYISGPGFFGGASVSAKSDISYVDRPDLLNQFKGEYSALKNKKILSRSDHGGYRQCYSIAEIMDEVLSNPKASFVGLCDGAKVLMGLLKLNDCEFIDMSDEYKKFKTQASSRNSEQIFQDFVMSKQGGDVSLKINFTLSSFFTKNEEAEKRAEARYKARDEVRAARSLGGK